MYDKLLGKLPDGLTEIQNDSMQGVVKESVGMLAMWRDLKMTESDAKNQILVFVKARIDMSVFQGDELKKYCDSMVSEVYVNVPSKKELRDSAKAVTKVLDKKALEIELSPNMVKKGVREGLKKALQETREKEAREQEEQETREKAAQVEAEETAAQKAAEEAGDEASMPAPTHSKSYKRTDVTEKELKKQTAEANANLLNMIDLRGDIPNQPKTPLAKTTTSMWQLAKWWDWLCDALLSLIGKNKNDKASKPCSISKDGTPGEADKGVDEEKDDDPEETTGRGAAEGAGKAMGIEADEDPEETTEEGAGKAMGKETDDGERRDPAP